MRRYAFPKVLLAYGFLGLACVYGVANFAFPLELAHLKSRWQLRQAGVTTLSWAGGMNTYERNFCSLDGQDSSDCECLLLIHGLGDEALTWKRLLLSERSNWIRPIRLIAPDLPGSGSSPAPTALSSYRITAQAERLAEGMLTTEGCTRWIVVGNSLGGWIAARMAIDFPAQLNRLVLLSPSGLRGQADHSSGELVASATVDSLKEFQKRAYFRPRELPPYVWWAAARRARHGNSRVVRDAQSESEFLDGKLSRIQAPTFLFWGEADRISPVNFAHEFETEIKGSHLRREPQCGHLPQKECPQALIGLLNSAMLYGVM